MLEVRDSAGAVHEQRTLASNSRNNKTLHGAAGEWQLQGLTRDLNGQLIATLTCRE